MRRWRAYQAYTAVKCSTRRSDQAVTPHPTSNAQAGSRRRWRVYQAYTAVKCSTP
ncbi:hypothetical protein ACVXG9_08860 [Escherichia coli]